MGYALIQKGQVTIPKNMRELLSVGLGNHVEFVANTLGEVTNKAANSLYHQKLDAALKIARAGL
jgi:bifunctional DNA-binding transcriptional regulator/antitoxin component of YhaV-PrlF toxin-antitoxin module